MYYFLPHLNSVSALPLGNSKFKFLANLEDTANKTCHMNKLSLHSYRKIKLKIPDMRPLHSVYACQISQQSIHLCGNGTRKKNSGSESR